MHFEFENSRVGQFQWNVLHSGLAPWQVRMQKATRGEDGATANACCGSCNCR